MKKLILILALALPLCANAQLEVLGTGQTVLGSSAGLSDKKATLYINTLSGTSSSSNMPHLNFGTGSDAAIGGDGKNGILKFLAKNTLIFSVGSSDMAFYYQDIAKTFNFQYNVKAPSFLTTSDARLKKNVESTNDIYLGLKDINSVSYNLAVPAAIDSTAVMGKASQLTESAGDDRVRFGFIAQEIQKIYPNLVVEDENGMLSIDYTGFIPLLVDAYKSLSAKVSEQEETIADLMKIAGPIYKPASVSVTGCGQAALRQNRPNPFSASTSIECTVPQTVATAFICVYDLQGQQVHRVDIRERGDVTTVIDAASLRPGMYIYTLVADGSEIDSKRMIITD